MTKYTSKDHRLTLYKTYSIKIQIQSSFSHGVGHLISAPMAPPLNIIAETIKSTEIMVTWDPPSLETQNGDLSGYKVYQMF